MTRPALMRRGGAIAVGVLLLVGIALLWARRPVPPAESAESEPASTPRSAPAMRLGEAALAKRAPARVAEPISPRRTDPVPRRPVVVPDPPRRLPLRVDLVDATSGDAVEGTWLAEDPVTSGERSGCLRDVDVERVRDASFVASGGVIERIVSEGSLEEVLSVRTQGERRAWDRNPRLEASIASEADTLVCVMPTCRVIPLRLRVPAGGMTLDSVAYLGRRGRDPWGCLSEARDGRWAVPFIPGEEVRATVMTVTSKGGKWETRVLEWKGVVPDRFTESWDEDMSEVADPRDGDPPVAVAEVEPAPPADRPPETTWTPEMRRVEVRALDRDGRAVPGAQVKGAGSKGMTDAAGVATIEVPVGPRTFSMTAPGRLTRTLWAIVPSEEPLVLELREPAGAPVDVEVVDAQGRPVSFARVDFGSARWFDVAGREQRVDSYTDALGRRRFARVEPGTQRVHAYAGSRQGQTQADFPDRERASVRVVVK